MVHSSQPLVRDDLVNQLWFDETRPRNLLGFKSGGHYHEQSGGFCRAVCAINQVLASLNRLIRLDQMAWVTHMVHQKANS
jgi:hypothetical protein